MLSSVALLLSAAVPSVWAQAGCSPLHFVWTRATTEPPTGVDNASAEEFEAKAEESWSKGYGAAGYSIFTNVTALIPDATGYPTHYPASWTGCPSEEAGIEDLTEQLTTMSQQCPDQKYVLGGHSQGGVVTVKTIPTLPEDILSRIIAVTMVGSPSCPAEVGDRCKSYCHAGDEICETDAPISEIGRCTSSPTKRSAVDYLAVENDLAIRSELAVRQADGPPDCSEPEPPEKGHEAGGSLRAHMSYSADGLYVRAAACYILNQYEASKTNSDGGGGAEVAECPA